METKVLRRPISGRAIRAAREWQEMTQRDLADALAEQTGDEWTAAQVLNLESGRKVLDVETAYALSKIQQMPMDWYVIGLADRVAGAIPGYLSAQMARLSLGADDAFPDELLPGLDLDAAVA